LSVDLKKRFEAILEKHVDEDAGLSGYRVISNEAALADLKKNKHNLINHVRQYFAKVIFQFSFMLKTSCLSKYRKKNHKRKKK
jgi:hypothetical protein